MSRPRLILHAGLHKTGTTALQQFAARNRERLRERGLWYPTYEPVRRGPCGAHNLLAHSFACTRKSAKFSSGEIKQLVGYWHGHIGNDSLFLSAEALCRHVIPDAGPDWVEQRLRYLERVASAFSDFDVEVVFVLRRQDQFVHSAYLENIMKATRLASLSFPEFRKVFEQGNLRYEDNLNVFVRVFDRVHVMLYEDLQTDGHLCANFLRNLGFDADDLPEPGKIRESFTIDQARVKRVLLPIVVSRGVNNRVNALLRTSMVSRLSERLLRNAGIDFWEDDLVRRQWQQVYEKENERIRHRFFPGNSTLFTNDNRQVW